MQNQYPATNNGENCSLFIVSIVSYTLFWSHWVSIRYIRIIRKDKFKTKWNKMLVCHVSFILHALKNISKPFLLYRDIKWEQWPKSVTWLSSNFIRSYQSCYKSSVFVSKIDTPKKDKQNASFWMSQRKLVFLI